MDKNSIQEVVSTPHYKELVRKRATFSNTLAIIMLASYYLFILAIAFMPDILRTPISQGSVTSVGLVIGVGIIFLSFILTGIYTYVANSKFDALTQKIKDEIRDKS